MTMSMSGGTRGRKLSIGGKGGVGKTMLCATLAKVYADSGRKVYAIDADPDSNLAGVLGYQQPDEVVPLSQMRDLIAERTGTASGESYGKFFKLNPEVSDIPEKFGAVASGVHFMTLGGIARAGGGCACPESAFLKALLSYLVLHRDEVVIIDLEAGVEHLGRATIAGTDALIVVVEPGRRSIESAERICRLADELGVSLSGIVGNKVRTDEEAEWIRSAVAGKPYLGTIRYDDRIALSDRESRPPFVGNSELTEQVTLIRDGLEEAIASASRPD